MGHQAEASTQWLVDENKSLKEQLAESKKEILYLLQEVVDLQDELDESNEHLFK